MPTTGQDLEPLAGDRSAALSESHELAPVSKNYGERDTREHGAHFVPPNRAIASPTIRRFDGQSLSDGEDGDEDQVLGEEEQRQGVTGEASKEVQKIRDARVQ